MINIDSSEVKNGDLSTLTFLLTNIGSHKTLGIDWYIRYCDDIFTVGLDTTYLFEFKDNDIS